MMKQLFTTLALFFVFQITMGQDTKFAIKGGVNFSNLKIESDFGSGSPDGNVSIYAGLLADFELSESFHFQPEVLYSIEGAEDASLTFVNIPLMGKFFLNEEFSLQAGPQIGFLVDAEGGTEGLKSMNIALNIGAAYQLGSGFFFDTRYNFGISNILEDTVGNEKVLTRGFQLGVGYFF